MTTKAKDQETAEAGSSGRATGYVCIVRAAIQTPTGAVYSLPRPARHHDVIAIMEQADLPRDVEYIQGFVTSEGGFVDRKEAIPIAEAAGQIPVGNHVRLFSEDIW